MSSPAKEDSVPVLIVGAGGAGLSLSLLLQQQGIASVLVERRPDVSWYPRARNLNFRTLEVFRGLGLEEQVIAAGAHFSRTLRKTTLGSDREQGVPSVEQFLHIADHLEVFTPEPPFWYCPQSRLEPLLLGEAKRRGCDVRYNTELVSFTQDSKGVSATITDRANGVVSVLQSDYLLAADGAHSHIRKALGVNGEGMGVLEPLLMQVLATILCRSDAVKPEAENGSSTLTGTCYPRPSSRKSASVHFRLCRPVRIASASLRQWTRSARLT